MGFVTRRVFDALTHAGAACGVLLWHGRRISQNEHIDAALRDIQAERGWILRSFINLSELSL
jgi:hypothetical protein